MFRYKSLFTIILYFSLLNGFFQSPLFNTIQFNLNKYRQVIDSQNFIFRNGIISLELNGRRTNIKSQLLLGFYSVGRAIQKVEVYCNEVIIKISYNNRAEKISVRAPVAKVLELSSGRLSPEQFFTLINY